MPPASTPLKVRKVRGATVMPLAPHPHRRPETYEFGVFTRRGRIVRKSLLFRNYGRQGFPADFAPTSDTDPRTVVFAGHLVATFGHFLLEGLSRLWYAKAHPELPIVWVGWAAEPTPSYRRWQRELLEVLGIENEAIFLNEPTRFKSVHVPQVGYRIKDWCSDQYADFLAVYPKRPRDPTLKLWLSRAEVNAGLGSTFAHRLDRQLAEHGWSIVRPEKLHIREQLELLATASRVAGEEGSAFHSLALLSDVSGLEVDIIGRFPDRAAEDQNRNYQTVANATGLQQRMHLVPEERMLFAR
ncbi:MAG: glycosyltransferase 61 family protein, partial [Chloroflexota bacterium]|nr:glycosyltransferase 61 family protein [Chloroflexota bacterium]